MAEVIPAERQKCSYHYGGWDCPFDAEEGPDRLCIFHLPVDKKKPEDFWRHLANYIHSLVARAGDDTTEMWAGNHPGHWIFRERDEELFAFYRSIVKPAQPWTYRGFVFPPMEEVHDFRGFVFRHADFSQAVFASKTEFRLARFHGPADFHGARMAAMSLAEVVFEDTANFKGASFGGHTSLWCTWFLGDASFNDAVFRGDVNAVQASFLGEASFFGTSFDKGAMFDFAQFQSTTDFTRAEVQGVLRLHYAVVRGKMVFRGTQLGDAAVVALWGVQFLDDTMRLTRSVRGNGFIVWPVGQVEFCDMVHGMNRVSFLNTEIYSDRPYVRFRNVTWDSGADGFIYDARFTPDVWHQNQMPNAATPASVRSELAILLHVRDREDKQASMESAASLERKLTQLVRQDVERIAREIRRATEAYGSYSDAGNYYAAEMEYRRTRSDSPASERIALSLYGWVSGYGEKPLRALARLLMVLGIASAIYPYTGFCLRTTDEVHLRLTPDVHNWWPTMLAFAKSALFSLAHVVPGFLRSQDCGPTSDWTTFVLILQTLCCASVVALFLLAIRRRFRR